MSCGPQQGATAETSNAGHQCPDPRPLKSHASGASTRRVGAQGAAACRRGYMRGSAQPAPVLGRRPVCPAAAQQRCPTGPGCCRVATGAPSRSSAPGDAWGCVWARASQQLAAPPGWPQLKDRCSPRMSSRKAPSGRQRSCHATSVPRCRPRPVITTCAEPLSARRAPVSPTLTPNPSTPPGPSPCHPAALGRRVRAPGAGRSGPQAGGAAERPAAPQHGRPCHEGPQRPRREPRADSDRARRAAHRRCSAGARRSLRAPAGGARTSVFPCCSSASALRTRASTSSRLAAGLAPCPSAAAAGCSTGCASGSAAATTPRQRRGAALACSAAALRGGRGRRAQAGASRRLCAGQVPATGAPQTCRCQSIMQRARLSTGSAPTMQASRSADAPQRPGCTAFPHRPPQHTHC